MAKQKKPEQTCISMQMVDRLTGHMLEIQRLRLQHIETSNKLAIAQTALRTIARTKKSEPRNAARQCLTKLKEGW
jgi:hypothetical protein